MKTYKSDPQTIACGIDAVWSKLSDPEVIKRQIDKNAGSLPEQARQQLEKASFSHDAITIESPMGPVKLVVADKVEPTRVSFRAEGIPVQFTAAVDLVKVDDHTTQAVASLGIDVPVFLLGMVGGKLQDATNKFAQMLAMIPYQNI